MHRFRFAAMPPYDDSAAACRRLRMLDAAAMTDCRAFRHAAAFIDAADYLFRFRFHDYAPLFFAAAPPRIQHDATQDTRYTRMMHECCDAAMALIFDAIDADAITPADDYCRSIA